MSEDKSIVCNVEFEEQKEPKTQVKSKDYIRTLEEIVYLDSQRNGIQSAFKLFNVLFSGCNSRTSTMGGWSQQVSNHLASNSKSTFDSDYSYDIRSVYAGKRKGTVEHFETILEKKPTDTDDPDGRLLAEFIASEENRQFSSTELSTIDIEIPCSVEEMATEVDRQLESTAFATDNVDEFIKEFNNNVRNTTPYQPGIIKKSVSKCCST